MNSLFLRLCVILPLLIAGGIQGLSDVIRMTNGGTLEGAILEEGEEKIVVRTQLGRITLLRRNIASIERKDFVLQAPSSPVDPENSSAPKEFEGMLQGITLLDAMKKQSEAASKALKVIPGDILRSDAELSALADAIAAHTKTLSSIEAREGQGPRFFAALAQYKELEARRERLRADHNRALIAYPKAVEQVNGYYEKLEQYVNIYTAGKSAFQEKYGEQASHAYFRRVEERLLVHQVKFRQKDIPAVRVGSHLLLDVLVDGKTKVRLMLDTGASVITLHEKIADQLGIPPDVGQAMNVQLADGRKIPARLVVLKKVSVGDFAAENVEAAILKHPPDSLSDGLLGMSFLRRFSMHYNLDAGILKLQDINLPPRPAIESLPTP